MDPPADAADGRPATDAGEPAQVIPPRPKKLSPVEVATLANRRVHNILRTYGVVARRTLESKIAEAGRTDLRVTPRPLGTEINNMIARGEIIRVNDGNPADILALPGTPQDEIDTHVARITALYAVLAEFGGDNGALGDAGEEMIRKAFLASPAFRIICDRWGDVCGYNGVVLEQSSDGLVLIDATLQNRPTIDGVALIEIKNRREWIYPRDYRVWKLIRNAYLVDAVGIFFGRRIHGTTFGYSMKKAGALGIEMFAQFATPNMEQALAPVRDKRGLGFHDIYFRDEVPLYLQRRIDKLADLILGARDRMKVIRPIIEPFLADLANQDVRGRARVEAFDKMRSAVQTFDTGEEADDDEAIDPAIVAERRAEEAELMRELEQDAFGAERRALEREIEGDADGGF